MTQCQLYWLIDPTSLFTEEYFETFAIHIVSGFMILIIRNGRERKYFANRMRMLKVVIFVVVAREVSTLEVLLITLDVRINNICINVTIINARAPKKKLTCEKMYSFFNSRNIGKPTSLKSAARHTKEINVNINLLFSTDRKFA